MSSDDRKVTDFNTTAAENQIISEFEEFQQRALLSQINAVPLRDNFFEWHFNLFPKKKKNLTLCIHGCLKFDRNPRTPPIIEILSPQITHPKIVVLNGHYHVNLLNDAEQGLHVSPTDILRRLAKLFEKQKFQKTAIPRCICGHEAENHYPEKDKTYVFQHIVGSAALSQQNVDISNKKNQFMDCMLKTVLVDYGKVYYKALIKEMKFDTATPVRLGWGFSPEKLESWEKQEFYGVLFGTCLDENGGGYFLHKEPWKIGLNQPLSHGFNTGDVVTVGVDFETSPGQFLFAVNDLFVGIIPFPEFMRSGAGFCPVVGVLQSSIQMIFGGPPPEVENNRFTGFMSVREYLESDRGAYWWKHGVQYEWNDFFIHGISDEFDETTGETPKFTLEREVKRVFEFLSAPDLRRACEVDRTFRDIISRSTLLQQANLFCYYTRKRYTDPTTVLGLMLDVRRPNLKKKGNSHLTESNGNPMFSILSLTASRDYLSLESWERGPVRTDSSSGRKEYNQFLPMILTGDHGARAFEQLPKCMGSVCGKSGDATVLECFDGLAALMNGTIQTLADGFDPFRAPSLHLQDETLRLFSQIHHMMLYMALEHPQIVDYATSKCQDFAAKVEDVVPPLGQLGMMIAYLFVLGNKDITWHTIRRQYVNEIWARDVSTYFSKKRDLENPGYPMDQRVMEVWEATKASKRTFHTLIFSFFAVHFRGEDSMLQNYEATFGMPLPDWHNKLQVQCENMTTKMESWRDYFKYLSCGHPPQQMFGPMLYKALELALRRGYVVSKSRNIVSPVGGDHRGRMGGGPSGGGSYSQHGPQTNGYGRGRSMGRMPRGSGGGSPPMRGGRGSRGMMRGVPRRGGRGRGDYDRSEIPMRNSESQGRFRRPDEPPARRGNSSRRPDARRPSRGRGGGGAPYQRGSTRPMKTGRFNLNAMDSVVYPPKQIGTLSEFPQPFQKTLEAGNVTQFNAEQQEALSAMTGGGSVHFVAPVGSGKTIVALVAALYRLMCRENCLVIILCADNIRVGHVSSMLSGLTYEFPSITVAEQCKGSRYMQERQVKSGRTAIVGTNGRVSDLMTRFETMKEAVQERLVGVYVLDADFTLHASQITRTSTVFENVYARIPCSIFSNSWCKSLDNAVGAVKGEMEFNRITRGPTHEPKYWFVSCGNGSHRLELFCDLIEQNPLQKCVVFCNQQKNIEPIMDVAKSQVRGKGITACTLENAKERAADVARGRFDILVSTDYGSPAISKCGCRVIINFEISTRDFQTFTKRIGLLEPSPDGPIHVINMIVDSDSSHRYWEHLENELGIVLTELEQNIHTLIV